LKKLIVDPQFDVTVIDNKSTDDSGKIAKDRGWTMYQRPIHTNNRVDNWKTAVEHFLDSKGEWCKWLFTGDHLHSSSYLTLKRAIEKYPAARLIIAEYDIVSEKSSKRWSIFPQTTLINPQDSMLLIAQLGNWFGSPIGHCFHRDAIINGFSFGHWNWAADMQFTMEIAKKHPVLYLKECIGEFHENERKTFSIQCNSLKASVEEYHIRHHAAREYYQMTGNNEEFQKLEQTIDRDIERLMLLRAFGRSKNYDEIRHITNAISFVKCLPSLFYGIKEKLLKFKSGISSNKE
jgi:hypothetical protein